MKKTPFFYYLLILGLFISLAFNACKDPVDPPKPSKSFEVTLLKDSVYGEYPSYFYIQGGSPASLKCTYIVRNVKNDSVRYHVKIEALESVLTHRMTLCIGMTCEEATIADLFGFLGVWPKNIGLPNVFAPKQATDPATNSYLEMWAGSDSAENTKPGINKFRVTYTNADDPTDYVSFILTFNFYDPADGE